VIAIMWLFQSLTTYTGVIRQMSIGGVEPTVWVSRHSTPLLAAVSNSLAPILRLRLRWPELVH
jgi:hypothetical protein